MEGTQDGTRPATDESDVAANGPRWTEWRKLPPRVGAGGGVPTGRREARGRKSGVPRCVLLSKFAFRRRGQQCRNCAYPGLGRVSESPAGDEKQAPVVGGRSRDGASEAA